MWGNVSVSGITLAIVLLLSGCERTPSDSASDANTHGSKASSQNATIQTNRAHARSASTATKQDADAKQAQCQSISQAMQAVDNHTQLPVIHAINQRLKTCIPHADNRQQLSWMAAHEAMYLRFLRLPDGEADSLSALGADNDGRSVIAPQVVSQLPARARYLASLLGKSEIVLTNLGEGEFSFDYRLDTTAKLFAPYLPDDQALFVTRMAADNQDPFSMDGGIVLPYADLAERAQFWEDFIRRYPESHFYAQAKDNFRRYQYYLFFGMDNTIWFEDNHLTRLVPNNRQYLQRIIEQAQSQSGQAGQAPPQLAANAKTYLAFVDMPLSVRAERYPVTLDKDATPRHLSQAQLARALPEVRLPEQHCSALGLTCKNAEMP